MEWAKRWENVPSDMTVHPTKTQISLRIRCPHEEILDPWLYPKCAQRCPHEATLHPWLS